MSDYIKREDARTLLTDFYREVVLKADINYARKVFGRAIEVLNNIPSADVVERKRGEWLECGIDCILSEEGDYENIVTMYVCSECDSDYLERSNFCPNCGADMRADRKE